MSVLDKEVETFYAPGKSINTQYKILLSDHDYSSFPFYLIYVRYMTIANIGIGLHGNLIFA